MRRTIATAFVLLLGCGPKGGTDVGNGVASVDVSGYEEPEPSSTQQALTLSDGATIDRVLIAIERIRLQAGTSCDSNDNEVDVIGPLVADLINGGFVAGAPDFAIPSGPFCELRWKYHKVASGNPPPGTPPELVGLSIYVEGTRADGTAFIVQSDVGDDLELEANDGNFELPASMSGMFVGYSLAPWITALNLDTLTGDPILISDTDNTASLSAFEDAIDPSARLFLDTNGNGQLDPAERAAGQALAD